MRLAVLNCFIATYSRTFSGAMEKYILYIALSALWKAKHTSALHLIWLHTVPPREHQLLRQSNQSVGMVCYNANNGCSEWLAHAGRLLYPESTQVQVQVVSISPTPSTQPHMRFFFQPHMRFIFLIDHLVLVAIECACLSPRDLMVLLALKDSLACPDFVELLAWM